MKRLPLLASFILFILLCASLAYWGMQLFKPAVRPVAAPPQAARAEVRPEAASALFGGRVGNAPVASNYQLKGVVMSGSPDQSVAILGADGKPAQAIRAGSELIPGVTVKEVHRDYVLLSENGAIKRVELPESAKGEGNIATVSPVRNQPATPAPVPVAAPAPAAPVNPAVPVTTPSAAPGSPAAAGQPVPPAAAPVPSPSPSPSPAVPAATAGAGVPAASAGAPPTTMVSPPTQPGVAPPMPVQPGRTTQQQGDPRLMSPGGAAAPARVQ